MRPWGLILLGLGLVGCAGGVLWEPVERVVLPGGLEVSWSGPEGGAEEEEVASPLVLRFRAVGEGPVVLWRVLRPGGPARLLVRSPEPGRFRYDAASDRILTGAEGDSPFSLAPAFRWYDLVLHPGGPAETVELGSAEPGSTVTVLLEYVPLSYRRLARAGYVAAGGEAAAEPSGSALRFARRSEAALRRAPPRQLFLRSAYLPPAMKVPLEIPWGAPR